MAAGTSPHGPLAPPASKGGRSGSRDHGGFGAGGECREGGGAGGEPVGGVGARRGRAAPTTTSSWTSSGASAATPRSSTASRASQPAAARLRPPGPLLHPLVLTRQQNTFFFNFSFRRGRGADEFLRAVRDFRGSSSTCTRGGGPRPRRCTSVTSSPSCSPSKRCSQSQTLAASSSILFLIHGCVAYFGSAVSARE